MPEDPIEEKSLEASPPEIPGMERLERRKGVVGEVDPKEQERFRKAAIDWMESSKRLGLVSDYRLVPEKLLTIEFRDIPNVVFEGEGRELFRMYYPKGALQYEASAMAILRRAKDDDSYHVRLVYKNVESRSDSRIIDLGKNLFLVFRIRSPVLDMNVRYGADGNLGRFEFIYIQSKEHLPSEIDIASLSSIEESGSVNYTTKKGQEVEFKMDEDPDYILVTSTKGEMKRVMKVPVKVDIAKIRNELEDGLTLEDPYNDPPEADKWLEKDLEKVVGIVGVPKETKAPK